MKLDRFQTFNEVTNPDVFKLDPNNAYFLSDAPLNFEFYGSNLYTLKIYPDKRRCELHWEQGQPLLMTYDEVPAEKDKIIALEPTTEQGEILYKWIARNLSVAEWTNTDATKWHTFEEEEHEPQPLGSTGYEDYSGYNYTLNLPNGLFQLEILRDLSTFKLAGPDMEYGVIGTLDDLTSNSEYYKSLSPDGALYRWIQFSFGNAFMRARNMNEDNKTSETRYEKLAVNHNTYELEYDPETDQGTLYLPPRWIKFSLEDIYDQLPELPALESGELDRKVRKRLEYYNIKMPPAPYEIGFIIKNRRTS